MLKSEQKQRVQHELWNKKPRKKLENNMLWLRWHFSKGEICSSVAKIKLKPAALRHVLATDTRLFG